MMSTSMITVLLWAAAVGSGVIAGVYLAFSTFIMPAFAKIDARQSIAAMNSINETILRSLFMPLFFGSSIVSLLLIIVAIVHWGEAGSASTLITGAVYFLGMFVCTVAFNVPLNNALARQGSYSDEASRVWSHYRITWTRWNHLRTVSSMLSCVLSIWLLTNQ